MSVKEYGSEFYLNKSVYKNIKDNNFIKDRENCLYLRSGRDAIRMVARKIKNEVNSILMPAFCCESMVKPIVDEGINIKFYKMTSELMPDNENIEGLLGKKDALLFINIFGRRAFTEKYLLDLKSRYPKLILIQDMTHEVLDKKYYLKIKIDYTVASLRKWHALPDGGVVYGDIGNKVDFIDKKENNYFSILREKALILKYEYMKSGELSIKNKYRKLLADAEKHLYENLSIESMSKISRKIIYENNYEFYSEKRKLNYEALKKELINLKNIKLLLASKENTPLYLPFITENVDKVQKMLASRNIYCPVIWPTPKSAKGICENSEYISKHILAIPCDHRYSLEDMKYIAKNLIEVLNLLQI